MADVPIKHLKEKKKQKKKDPQHGTTTIPYSSIHNAIANDE